MNRPKAQRDPLVDVVARLIDDRALIAPGSTVLVGVSGGMDSVSLLSVLRQLSEEPQRGYKLVVAHLNHCLRAEADGDAAFVANLAEQWGLRSVVERRDVAQEARRRKLGIEQAARAVRYEFLAHAAAGIGASAVAVGHHADDNVETILHRIIRGTHLRGLAGIPLSRPLGEGGTMLVRPLLESTRPQIEDYCLRQGLSWRRDSTNAELKISRNFIRHELLPLLRERLNPRVDDALLRLAAAAADAERHLSSRAKDLLLAGACARAGGENSPIVLDCGVLAGEGRLIRTCALRMLLEQAGAPMQAVTADLLAELAELVGKTGTHSVMLPGGYRMRMEDGKLTVEGAQDDLPASWAAVAVNCQGTTALPDGRRITCRMVPFDQGAFDAHRGSCHPGLEMLDAERIDGELICRPRLDGDAFHPLGSPGRQKVGDFLTNLKLPQVEREKVLCICDRKGIVCLCPLRIDERVRITAQTRQVLRLELLDVMDCARTGLCP